MRRAATSLETARFGDLRSTSLESLKALLARAGGALNRAAAGYVHQKNALVACSSRPVVSFTFDDAPRSAGVTGGAILKAAGAAGTYYVCGALSQLGNGGYLSTNELEDLNARGHEIACHTYSHPKLPDLTTDELRAEIDRNAAFLKHCCGDVGPYNFSYPYGAVSPGAKRVAGKYYSSCRGTSHGINTGTLDLSLLKAVRIYENRTKLEDIEKWFDKLCETKGWLIFYTHDVGNSPSAFGTSIRLFESCVVGARRRNFHILTVRDAMNTIVRVPLGSTSSGEK